MLYAKSWLHPKMQIKDSDFKVTREFNNCNIVDLATQNYLKSTNLLINHHYTYNENEQRTFLTFLRSNFKSSLQLPNTEF